MIGNKSYHINSLVSCFSYLIIPYSHNSDKIIITVKNIKTNHSLMISILFLSCLAYEWPWKNVKTNKKIWTGEVVWFKSMPQYCKVKEINIKHARLCTSCYKNLTKHSSNAIVRLKYIYIQVVLIWPWTFIFPSIVQSGHTFKQMTLFATWVVYNKWVFIRWLLFQINQSRLLVSNCSIIE